MRTQLIIIFLISIAFSGCKITRNNTKNLIRNLLASINHVQVVERASVFNRAVNYPYELGKVESFDSVILRDGNSEYLLSLSDLDLSKVDETNILEFFYSYSALALPHLSDPHYTTAWESIVLKESSSLFLRKYGTKNVFSEYEKKYKALKNLLAKSPTSSLNSIKNKLIGSLGVSSQKAEYLSNILIDFLNIKAIDHLSDAELDNLIQKVIGISLDDASNLSYNQLIKKAADSLGVTPDQVEAFLLKNL